MANSLIISPVVKILMCRPTYYQVKYSINPWMNPKNRVDTTKAIDQWELLKETIEKCGAKVVVMEPHGTEHYPDLVFTANAAIVRGKAVYLATFENPERQGERFFYKQWFERNGFRTHYTDAAHEGTGDALWGCKGYNTLLSGVGPRSDTSALRDISRFLSTSEDRFKIYALRLVDPRFYHLDTCFCPLNETMALWYPRAFCNISRHNLRNLMKLIPVPEYEAKRFACNAVVIGNNVIMHKGNHATEEILAEFGYRTHFVDMSEFIKSGGSTKCCTLRLE